MSSNIAQAPKIEVENEELETVQHYIYLGQMIQNNGSQEKELKKTCDDGMVKVWQT